MLIPDIKRVIEQISRDKGIDSQILIRAVEEALKSAAKKKYGNRIDIEVKYNEDAGEIEVFQFKEVVDEVEDPDLEISVEEGLRVDPDCEVGDSLGYKMDTTHFGRIAAQSAKQVIIQKMKDAEREAVYDAYINRKGEIINGIVQRFERGNLIVNLGHLEAILPAREQSPRDHYKRGDRVRAYILDVRRDTYGPQIVLSRTHPDFLACLLRTEVPEVSEGIVNIVEVSREAGNRSKVAVTSADADIDPVGACVGVKGNRIKTVVDELRDEKIDIVPWHVDPARFVCNALSPAQISRVIIDEENRSMEVIVEDADLAAAIGKAGVNVRLASRLTKWRLDVKSESSYSEVMRAGYNSLLELPGVGIRLADALYERGFYSADEIRQSTVEDLMSVRDLTEEEAEALIEAAETHADAAAAGRAADAGLGEAAGADAAAADDAGMESTPEAAALREEADAETAEAARTADSTAEDPAPSAALPPEEAEATPSDAAESADDAPEGDPPASGDVPDGNSAAYR
jgi:N utilization substance protein A